MAPIYLQDFNVKVIYTYRKYLPDVRCACLLGLLLVSSLGLRAQAAESIRVIEATAIPYLRFLSKPDFDARYPGELLPERSQLEPGWYVVYQHQALNYYFGPILLQVTGEDYRSQLQAVVASAVAQRPSIQDYELALRYEPESKPVAEPSPSASPSSDTGATPPPPSLWNWVRRIFGFGR